jgi:hypothetical protein
MRSRAALLGIVLAGVAALAACGGLATSGTVPVIMCVLPAGTQVALAYPVPGATGVPDSPGQIVVAVSSPLPATWQVVVEVPGQVATGGALLTAILPSAIPTPYATPSFASPAYETSGLTGSLPAASTVQIGLNDESSDCNSYPLIGSFTTH